MKKECKLKQIFGMFLINIYVIKIYLEIIASYYVCNRSYHLTTQLYTAMSSL